MHVKTMAFAAAAALTVAVPAAAHHSFAMFDNEKEMTIEGVVKTYSWTNPHVWIDVSVTDTAGKAVNWGLESRSLGILSRLGWQANSVKPGDKVSVRIHPMKDGTPGGSVMTVTFEDGRELRTQGGGANG